MLEDTLKAIKRDFGEDLAHVAVHEISHAIFAIINSYNVKKIILTEQISNGKKIDGKAVIDFSSDNDIIVDLCSASFTGTLATPQEYKKLGIFYIKLLLTGYVGEDEFLGLKMDFISNSTKPASGFNSTFDNTYDGSRCRLILANNHNHKLGMPRLISDYYSSIIGIIQNENYKIILDKLLIKAFYYDLFVVRIRKSNPQIKRVDIIGKLLRKYNL